MVVVLVGGVLLATAATLGGIRASQLTGYAVAAAPNVPTVLAWDPFDAPANTNLHGRTPVTGGTWTVHAGTWRLDGAGRAGMQNNATNGRATIDVGTTDYAVTVPLTFPTGARRAGVAVRVNGSGTQGFYVEIRNITGGQLAIGTFSNNSSTVLTTVSGLGNVASLTLRVEVDGDEIRAYVDGVLLATYTLTPAQVATYGSNTRVGLWANGDRQTDAESFLVETLP